MKNRVQLSELKCYQESTELSNKIWDIVLQWEYFPKDTIGKQFVRAADSIPANIAEGYGRFHFQDSIKFYYYARGSIYETQHWMAVAMHRKLVRRVQVDDIDKSLDKLPIYINGLIKATYKQKEAFRG